MTRLLSLVLVVAAFGLVIEHGVARADAAAGLLVNHTWLQPRGDARATGLGADFGVVETRKPFMMTIGGFYAIGQPDGNKRMRDVYNARWGFGFKPKLRRAKALVPFIGVGLDFLYVSTRLPDNTAHAGATLGFDARAGVFGVLSKRWIYQVSVSYIGAIVPGLGDGLDGAVLQIGIGKILLD